MAHEKLYADDVDDDGRAAAAAASRDREAGDWRALMASEAGRRTAWRILSWSRLADSTFHQNHAQMCLYEGRRTIGLELLGALRKHCGAEQVQLMERENQWLKK